MGDWFRSVTVLVMAFVGAVVVTIGLATVIVPGGSTGSQRADGADDGGAASPSLVAPTEGVGGHLTVTGDREGTMILTQEANENRYSLTGAGTRLVFEGQPPTIAQISWDGMEFFPEPSDCTITPGDLDHQLGIGYADVECIALSDIRSGETVDMAGRVGVALTLVGESELPEMGGSVTVGDETWEFDEALLFAFAVAARGGADETDDYNMILVNRGSDTGCPGSPCAPTSLRFSFDIQTHRLTLANVQRDGEDADQAPGACSLESSELGRVTPTTSVLELTIDCPAAEVPGLGAVPIAGTVIVQNVEFVP
jgi:hypothetical protein